MRGEGGCRWKSTVTKTTNPNPAPALARSMSVWCYLILSCAAGPNILALTCNVDTLCRRPPHRLPIAHDVEWVLDDELARRKTSSRTMVRNHHRRGLSPEAGSLFSPAIERHVARRGSLEVVQPPEENCRSLHSKESDAERRGSASQPPQRGVWPDRGALSAQLLSAWPDILWRVLKITNPLRPTIHVLNKAKHFTRLEYLFVVPYFSYRVGDRTVLWFWTQERSHSVLLALPALKYLDYKIPRIVELEPLDFRNLVELRLGQFQGEHRTQLCQDFFPLHRNFIDVKEFAVSGKRSGRCWYLTRHLFRPFLSIVSQKCNNFNICRCRSRLTTMAYTRLSNRTTPPPQAHSTLWIRMARGAITRNAITARFIIITILSFAGRITLRWSSRVLFPLLLGSHGPKLGVTAGSTNRGSGAFRLSARRGPLGLLETMASPWKKSLSGSVEVGHIPLQTCAFRDGPTSSLVCDCHFNSTTRICASFILLI